MGRRRTIPVTTVSQFWDALTADYGIAGSYGLAIEDILDVAPERLAFYDEFNRTAEDTDVWVSGGDAGTFLPANTADFPTSWHMRTGATTDNDRYINGFGCTKNIKVTHNENGYTTATMEVRMALDSAAAISVFIGLHVVAITDYVEPAFDCAHFLMDPAITNTFRARSYDAAEEETDTLVVLDTDFHILRIVWTAASVLFYIDDVLVATHAAQVPDQILAPCLLIRTEADAQKGIYMDYVHMEVT